MSPAVHYLAVVFRLCALLAHMHLWGQAWHLCMGKKQVMAQRRWVFSVYLCRSVAVQGAVAYLVSAFHSNDTELFSCLRLPCVTSCKVSSDKMKASTAACERWSKTSRFYSSALSLHYNHFFFFFFFYQFVVVKVAQNTYPQQRVNLFGKISPHKLVWQEW